MHRKPENSGIKRNRNDDGSERNFLYLKYNDIVVEMPEKSPNFGEMDEDDDGF